MENERFLPENCFEGKYLPIGKAIYNGDEEEIVKQLKINKVSIDEVGKGGRSGKPTFLMYAVYLEKPDMVEALLKMKADPGKLSLIAVQKKSIDLKTGEEKYYFFNNPLTHASGYIKNISKAKKISGLLIDYGADVNGWGNYYNAPLYNAVIMHSDNDAKEMVDFFLSKGANINGHLDRSSGSTLLTCLEGEWPLVEYLLDKGADPRVIDFTGWNFMWDVESRLKRGSFKPQPELEALKNRLIKEYGMAYPPVQDKARGDSLRQVEYKKKGWAYDENGKLIVPEDLLYYNEIRKK